MKTKSTGAGITTVLKRSLLALAAVGLITPLLPARAGTWVPLANQPTNGAGIGQMLLLTDGTVMASQGGTRNWYRLVPDTNGGYVTGTWTNMAPMNNNRTWFASCVLRDGRVLVAGGEYGDAGHGTTAELYDPLKNTWTYTRTTAGVLFADSASVMLPDGKVLVSGIYSGLTNVIYDPVADNWLAGPDSIQDLNEAGWVKLPDESILAIDPYRPGDSPPDYGTNSERYIPSLNQWIADASVPVRLYSTNSETGPAILLPDGRIFFAGGTGRTALYTPSGGTSPGTWAIGPTITNGLTAEDCGAAMMVDGRILCAFAAPTMDPTGTNIIYSSPTRFFEYDYTAGLTGAFIPTNGPTGPTLNTPSYNIIMLALPSGEVLLTYTVSQLYVYRPAGSPLPAGKPSISSVTANGDGSFHLTGTLLNGISAGAFYGDDAQMDSNYPLVRLTNNSSGRVYYGRTFNWSSAGVQTGSKPVSTEFTVPNSLYQPGESYSLVVVANGIASDPIIFLPPIWVDFNYAGSAQNGSYALPYKRFTNAVNAVASGGTIFIKTTGHSAETNRITKAMRIVAYGGTATVGR